RGRRSRLRRWCGIEDNRGEAEIRADEVSGLVESLGPLNKPSVILPCDDEAAVRKASHVAEELPARLMEGVDENVALAQARAAHCACFGSIGFSEDLRPRGQRKL